jgi:DNA-binding transcriptional MerR regulator
MKTYRIKELAESLGVSRRTIHYYLGRGLLPPSEGAGLGTTYTQEHYYRILLIKKWQKAFFPLEEIRKRIQPLTLEEVQTCLNEEEIPFFKQVMKEKPLYGESWIRIPLEKGQELHYRIDDLTATGQAKEIVSWFHNQKKEVS